MARTRITRLAAAAAVAIAAGGLAVAVTPSAALAAPAPQPSTARSPFRVISSPGPVVGSHQTLRASTAISASDVWAVGNTDGPPDSFGGASIQPLAEHWNGSAWSVVPTPITSSTDNGWITAVSAVSSTDVWAVGRRFIEHWNGTAWSIVPTPAASFNSVFAISSSNVYAVGSGVEHWNGARWSLISTALVVGPDGGSEPKSVSASSASDVWVVGEQAPTGPGGIYQGFAEHFNGRTWTMSPFLADPTIDAVQTVSPTTAWAVGDTIWHWDGKTWTRVPNVVDGAGHLQAITKLSATDLWAVGYASTADRYHLRTFAEHFNGTSWSAVPTPSPGTDPTLFGVSAAGGHVYAVGETQTSGPNAIPQIIENLILENDNG